MKACEGCNRVSIGENFKQVSAIRAFLGLPLIYIPIVFLPFVALSGLFVYVHLRMMGATNIKSFWDFLPNWKSHRYSYKTQIVNRDANRLSFWSRSKSFWIFNCTAYCPVSVAFAGWLTYLVKVVENWWCPFAHEHKDNYGDARIDYSYWHTAPSIDQLHPMDRENPIWNQDAQPHVGEEVS